MRNCRKMATSGAVLLTEVQDDETFDSTCQLACTDVTLRAKGDHGQIPSIPDRIWHIQAPSVLLKNTASFTRHGKNVLPGRDGAVLRKHYMEWLREHCANLVKELSPHGILQKINQCNKEIDEVFWTKGSTMKGQRLYQKNRGQCDLEEHLFIRSIQGHSV